MPSCLIKVDFPPMLGPVTNIKLEFHVSSISFPIIVSFGIKLSPPEPHGYRPSMSSTNGWLLNKHQLISMLKVKNA